LTGDSAFTKTKKSFSIKQLAYDYKKANKDMVKQLSSSSNKLSTKVQNTLKKASLARVENYLEELQ